MYYRNAERDQSILEADGWLPGNPEMEMKIKLAFEGCQFIQQTSGKEVTDAKA